MCLNGGGAPCENRKCIKEKGLKSCLLCGDYLVCKHTEYQREGYPFVVDNYYRVRKVGFENILKRKRKEAEQALT